MSFLEILSVGCAVGFPALAGYAWLIRLDAKVIEVAAKQQADMALLAERRESDRERMDEIRTQLATISARLGVLNQMQVTMARIQTLIGGASPSQET